MLSLSVSKLIRLVGKQGMVGALANLYESKDALLKPPVSPVTPSAVHMQSIRWTPAAEKKFYICGDCRYNGSTNHVSDDRSAICPSCNRTMTQLMQYVAPPAAKQFLKGVGTYMVMDDLVVKPLSTISSFTLLSKFHVKEVGAL